MARWMSSPDRKCAKEPLETFITVGDEDDEPPYPSPRARELCNRCPFRPECLKFAIDNDVDYGVWGGMSRYQREQISRKLERKSCPNCGGKDGIIKENNHEVCLACGISWPMW